MSLRNLNGWSASNKLEVLIDYQNARCDINRALANTAFCTLGAPVAIGGSQDPYTQNRTPFDDAGKYALHPAHAQALRLLKSRSGRFWGFNTVYWVHGNSNTINQSEFVRCADKCAQLIQELNLSKASSIITPYINDTSYPLLVSEPTLLADLAERLKGYGLEWLEPVSEWYRAAWGDPTYFPTVQSYSDFHQQAYNAIKTRCPSMRVALPLYYRRNVRAPGYPEASPDWGSSIATALYGKYDFITLKLLAREPWLGSSAPWDYKVLLGTQAIRLLEDVAQVDAFAPVAVTELAFAPLDNQTPAGDNDSRGSNILGALFRANMLILSMEDSDLLAMNNWVALTRHYAQPNPPYSYLMLAHRVPAGRTYNYWLYYYFNRFVGDQVLGTIGKTVVHTDGASSAPGMASEAYRSCSLLPILATKSDDERYLYLVVANLSLDTDYPVVVRFSNFRAEGHVAYILKSNAQNPVTEVGWDPAGLDPVRSFDITRQESSVSFTIPKGSVVFVRLEQSTPWKEVISIARRTLIAAKNPPVGATSAKLYVGRYPDEVFMQPPVAVVGPPLWEIEWDFDTWGLNYYGFEYNTDPPVFEGPYAAWDEATFWPIRCAEVVYNELVRHTEALSSIGAPHTTDPVVVHFGLARSLQPPYVAVSVPSVSYEPVGYPLQKWGTAFIEVEVCTKLGGISQPYTYHNSLVSAVVDILNRLLKAQTRDAAFFADRIDTAGPISDIEDSESMVLTSFVTMTAHVIYDGATK